MKAKKILSAVLSAAMLISCMTVGSGSVVQASVESRTNTGTNIARNLQIVAYSGQESDTHPIGAVNDGVKNDNNDHQRWQSKENLKGGASRDNAAYIIFDLGAENTPNSVRSFSQIKVKFHNMAYATDYKILTSDTCEIATEAQLSKTEIPSGWTQLIHKQHTGALSAFPEDVLEGKTDNVGRYLMFFFTAMNSGAGIDSVSVREIEIYNNPVTEVTMSQSTAEMIVGGEILALTATVNPADATQTAVQWSSNADGVATVDQSGIVTAVAPGEAVITATSKDNKSKSASCTVTVKPSVNKDELAKALEEAQSLNEEDYTPATWSTFNDAKVGANEVYQNADATQEQVNDAVKTIRETMNALERVYKVTVGGQEEARGVYNQIVTITAAAPEQGMKFAGWQLNGKIVSYDATYTFAIAGDMDFTATYAQEEEVITKPLYAAVANTAITKRADGKANVKYVAQLSIPEGYTLNEAGLLWYGKSDLASLTTENGPAAGVKKIATSTINTRYQFAIRVNGIPAGKTIRGVIYAKVTNNETQETTWVYSEEVKLTNN